MTKHLLDLPTRARPDLFKSLSAPADNYLFLRLTFEMVHARLLEQAATVNEIMQDNEWLALVI